MLQESFLHHIYDALAGAEFEKVPHFFAHK